MTTLLEPARTICPTCLVDVDGAYVEEGGAVYLQRTCAEHGDSKALVLHDVRDFVKSSERAHPPPSRDVVARAREQGTAAHPSCIALLEITDACNLACDVCYANSPSGTHVPFDVLTARLRTFIETRGPLDVLQISGGEPTIHPEFVRILDHVKRLPITHVMVNTNGIALADDDGALVRALQERTPRLEIYLQLDGLDDASHVALRGRSLIDKKRRALERLSDAGIPTTLVCTVVDGVNDADIAELLRLGLSLPIIRGVSFQPATTAGRYKRAHDPRAHATLSSVIDALARGTAGALRADDFMPLPCSHPSCCSFTVLARRGPGDIVPLSRGVDRALINTALKDTIAFTREDAAACCGIDMGPNDALRVVVKPFMDAFTYDQARIDECCVHIIDDAGRGVSFCEHNVKKRPALVSIHKGPRSSKAVVDGARPRE
jgi:uncharacterized radical SAM superfamily Fe-S cluster-containing enzyme